MAKPSNKEYVAVELKTIEAEQDDATTTNISILLQASSTGNKAKVHQILSDGLNADAADYDGRTGLHLAACEGQIDVVKIFLDLSADPNPKDRWEKTPMDEAVKNGHQVVAEMLAKAGGNFGAELGRLEGDLINAAATNNLVEAGRLLKAGVDVNCHDYDKRTPLHLAVGNGNLDMVDLLMEYKVDANFKDRWGQSPLDEAKKMHVRTGHDYLRDKFIKHGFDAGAHHAAYFSPFSVLFLILQVIFIILFFLFTEYGDDLMGTRIQVDGDRLATVADGQATVSKLYPMFQDVHVMIFIGFGYLMTFLRKNGYSSVGFTFLIGAFVIQYHQLVGGFFHQVFAGHGLHKIQLSLESLILSDFAAGAVLISYGVLLGKVSHFQILVMSVLEIIFFALNENICLAFGITDLGGSMIVHMFGAFFGMAASIVLKNKKAMECVENAAVYHSDMFAMIGTIFLWMFWPSFNGALGDGTTQHRAIVNTVLSLSGSCVSGFLFSHIIRKEGRFNMVDIQNATLAGGVAMGTCADLIVGPGGAVLIGVIAGMVSVMGYVWVQPFLEDKIGLHDTCGVNNLHGMPSIIGAIAGIIVTAQITPEEYGPDLSIGGLAAIAEGRTGGQQAVEQLKATLVTLAISIFTGALTGALMRSIDPPKDHHLFSDEGAWEVPETETPHFFDSRGEISRAGKNTEDTSILKNLASRLDLAESRIKTVAAGGTSKLESLFDKMLNKMEKLS
jgi:ammonium transporter Rh